MSLYVTRYAIRLSPRYVTRQSRLGTKFDSGTPQPRPSQVLTQDPSRLRCVTFDSLAAAEVPWPRLLRPGDRVRSGMSNLLDSGSESELRFASLSDSDSGIVTEPVTCPTESSTLIIADT